MNPSYPNKTFYTFGTIGPWFRASAEFLHISRRELNPQCRLFLENLEVAHFCPPQKKTQKERILVFQLYHFFFLGGKLAVKLLGCNKIGTIFLNDPAVWTTNLIPANGKSSFNLGRVSERLQVIKNKYGTGYLPLVPCYQDSCQPDFIIFDTC